MAYHGRSPLTRSRRGTLARQVSAKDRLPGQGGDGDFAARYRRALGAVTFRSYCWKGLGSVPEEALKHGALEKLWLHNNDLTVLPRALAALSSLRVLTLSRNARLRDPWSVLTELTRLEALELNGVGLEVVPEGLGRLTRLRTFELGQNYVRRLPERALRELAALEFLDVNDNRLEALPVDAFRALPRLREVQAFNNALTDLEAPDPPLDCLLWAQFPRRGPVWEYVATTHYLSLMTVCIIDENVRWLEEFVAYHLHLGFDHFYLYDNSGSAGCHCVDARGDAQDARRGTRSFNVTRERRRFAIAPRDDRLVRRHEDISSVGTKRRASRTSGTSTASPSRPTRPTPSTPSRPSSRGGSRACPGRPSTSTAS